MAKLKISHPDAHTNGGMPESPAKIAASLCNPAREAA